MTKVFSEPLACIFQQSVNSGKIPKVWKDARVTPLFIKGNKPGPGNYRPVSLTSVVYKCLETVIRAQILEHVVRNSHISDVSLVFVPGAPVFYSYQMS